MGERWNLIGDGFWQREKRDKNKKKVAHVRKKE